MAALSCAHITHYTRLVVDHSALAQLNEIDRIAHDRIDDRQPYRDQLAALGMLPPTHPNDTNPTRCGIG